MRPARERPPATESLSRWSFELAGAGLFALAATVYGFPVAGALGDADAWTSLAGDLPRIALVSATSLAIAAGALAVALPFGGCVAYALFRARPRPPLIGAFVLAMLLFCPQALLVAGWTGWIGPVGLLGNRPTGVASDLLVASILYGVAGLAWVALAIGVAWRAIGSEPEGLASLGRSPWRAFCGATLPLLGPAWCLAAALAVLPVLRDMTISDLFGLRTWAEEVYLRLQFQSADRSATLLAIGPWALLGGWLAFFWQRTWRRRGFDASFAPGSEPIRGLPFSAMTPLAAAAGLACGALLIGLPIQLGVSADYDPETGVARFAWSPGVAWAAQTALLGDWAWLLEQAARSLAAGIAATAIGCVLVGWSRGRPAARLAVTWLFCWGLALPGPVLGLGLIELLNRPDPTGLLVALYDSSAAIGVAQAAAALPLVLAVLLVSDETLDPAIDDAVRLHFGRGWRRFLALQLGGQRRVVGLAALVAWALCLTEQPATNLLAAPGTEPFTLRLFRLLHVGTGNEQAALGIAILTTVGLVAIGLAVGVRGGRRRPWCSPPR